MNRKLRIDRMTNNLEQRLIKSGSKFTRNNYPYGRDWMFDVKRMLNDALVIADAGANISSVSPVSINGSPGTVYDTQIIYILKKAC